MGSPASLHSLDSEILADASALINLNASKFAREIIGAFPFGFATPKEVVLELEAGKAKGRCDIDVVMKFAGEGLIRILEIGGSSEGIFEDLVVGDAVDTLDDGEAATIALAVERQGIAILDERKAIRICGERYPALKIASTVDLLSHPNVREVLGKQDLAACVEHALRDARMSILPQNLEWVISIIGEEKAGTLISLSRVLKARRAL